jgi:hypothetical protein
MRGQRIFFLLSVPLLSLLEFTTSFYLFTSEMTLNRNISNSNNNNSNNDNMPSPKEWNSLLRWIA